jgi:hypothetical protein
MQEASNGTVQKLHARACLAKNAPNSPSAAKMVMFSRPGVSLFEMQLLYKARSQY